MKQEIINRNEVIQGPSPKVLAILKKFNPEHATRYVEGYYNSILIPKISKIFKISEEQIIINYGEEDFLRTVFDHLNPKEDSVLTHEYHYAYYKKYLTFKGITLHTFKMIETKNDFLFDVEDCITQIKKLNPKVILLTSPNNPTGNSISVEELEKVLKNTNKQTLIVVDQAYWGFDKEYNEEKFLSLIHNNPNLIFLRSFSKLFALAGLRIGFALCGVEVKKMLNYQNRYLGLSRILEEVAIAALESKKYYDNLSQEIIRDRNYFVNELNNFKNFKAFNSKANFVLIRVVDNMLGPMKNALSCQKVVIAKFVNGNLLRVTIGSKKHTKKFLKLLEKVDKLTL